MEAEPASEMWCFSILIYLLHNGQSPKKKTVSYAIRPHSNVTVLNGVLFSITLHMWDLICHVVSSEMYL